MSTSGLLGYRGYITSRPFMRQRAPQHVQNTIIRDYCERNDLLYLLSVTEHIMPGCHLILNQLTKELGKLDGVVLYSIFQLPEDSAQRAEIYDRILSEKKSLHAAVEKMVIKTVEDVAKLEDIWRIHRVITQNPLPGYLIENN